ncbi:MAG: hypothetical protein WC209_08805 [Ignavibacteriaceae bacterium]|jgi:hypothetical protein
MKVVVGFYIIIQLLILVTIPISYTSDSLNYYKLAQQSIAAQSFYPAPQHLYEDYIIAPLFVNILVSVLSIYNSVLSIGILNICANVFQLFFVYKLAEKMFNINAAKTVVILYVFYLNSLGFIVMNLTELVFNCFVLGSIFFFLKGTKKSYILAGLLAGAAIGVRPIGWVLLIIYLMIGIRKAFKSQKDKKPFLILTGTAFFIILFGGSTYLSFGNFIFTSTNGPVNILIGASDQATGAFNAYVFNKGNSGYINNSEQKTFYEKEEIWKKQALDWILLHPIKWISLFPKKIVHIFAWDDITISHLFDSGRWNLYRVLKEMYVSKSVRNILLGFSVYEKVLFILVQVIHHLYYYFVIWMFFKSLSKKLLAKEGVIVSIAFILIGLFMNLITFGDARFKYPYIIFILVLISPKIYEIMFKNNLT